MLSRITLHNCYCACKQSKPCHVIMNGRLGIRFPVCAFSVEVVTVFTLHVTNWSNCVFERMRPLTPLKCHKELLLHCHWLCVSTMYWYWRFTNRLLQLKFKTCYFIYLHFMSFPNNASITGGPVHVVRGSCWVDSCIPLRITLLDVIVRSAMAQVEMR